MENNEERHNSGIVVDEGFYALVLEPVFVALGWEAEFPDTKPPEGSYIISGVTDRRHFSSGIKYDTYSALMNALLKATTQRFVSALPEFNPDEELPPATDDDALRHYVVHPDDVALLEQYTSAKFTVSTRVMTEKGKDEFEKRKWQCSGNHYGNKTLVISNVVDEKMRVVPIKSVIQVFEKLCMLYGFE